jgi:hypothetical protein
MSALQCPRLDVFTANKGPLEELFGVAAPRGFSISLFRLPDQIQPIENRRQNLFSGCKVDGVKMERTLPARVLRLVQAPRFRFTDDLAAGTLVEILPDFPPRPTPPSVLHPSNHQLSPRRAGFYRLAGRNNKIDDCSRAHCRQGIRFQPEVAALHKPPLRGC